MSDLLTAVQTGCHQALVAVKDWSLRAPGSPTSQALVTVKDWSLRAPGSLTSQALVVGTLVGFLAYQFSKKRYRLPPGPFALPLLGNLLSMNASDEAFYVKLRRWAREKYGPVVSVYMGPLLCVYLNSEEVATEAMVKRGDDFASRPTLHSLDVLSEGSRNIVFGSYSPAWKLHRKIAMQALRHYMSGDLLEKVVHQAVAKTIDTIVGKEKGAPFNPHVYNTNLMFNILTTICFGETRAFDDPEIKRLIEIFEEINSLVGNGFLEDVIPPLRYWPTQKYRTVIKRFQELLDFIYRNIDQHRKTFSAEHIRDLTDSILLAQSEAAREESLEVMAMFTDTHVGQTITDMYGAGVDTSRITLDWATLFLAGHPQVQQQMQAELDEVTGDRMPGVKDRPKLHYSQAVLYETMRLGVTVPTAIPHQTIRDTTVGGYDVPKGTMVMINQWAVLHDPDRWDQPEEFRPQRFLDQQGRLKKLDCWTPFSAGRRACLGETVAKPELLLILSCLLKRLTISLPEGAVYDPTYNVSGGLVFHMPLPYKVVMAAR